MRDAPGRRFRYSLIAIMVAMSVVGCDQSQPTITGEWSGTGRSESGKSDSMYLKIKEVEGNVSGIACERPGHDCYAIVNGKLVERQFTFHYRFVEHGTEYKVESRLILADDGDGLIGTATSTKAKGSFKVSLKRHKPD